VSGIATWTDDRRTAGDPSAVQGRALRIDDRFVNGIKPSMSARSAMARDAIP